MWQSVPNENTPHGIRPPNPLERYQAKAQPKAEAPASPPAAIQEPTPAPPRLHLEIIWQSDNSEERIAADRALGRLPPAPQPDGEPQASPIIGLPPELDDDETDDEPTAATVVQAALRSDHVTAIPKLEKRLHQALAEKHTDEPPLVLLRGRFVAQLNAQQVLQTMVDTAKPLATTGSNLESELTKVTSFVSTPLMQNPAVAQRLRDQLVKAWRGERHGLPDDFLTEHAESVVLHERGYATIKVLGEPCIICHLMYQDERVPVYLPEEYAQRLPLTTSFDSRVVGELFSQQDGVETATVSLRPLVLARVLSLT